MKAEIVATGDEVCSGAIVDSNSACIAETLGDLGIDVIRHSCVGDDLSALVSLLSEIGQRADLVIVTGGLGPTVDDLTAEAAAAAAGVDLELNRQAAEYIKRFFEKFSRPMAESDYKQAMLPKGAVPMLNAAGTAPGFIITVGKCRCYFLPGVPSEMKKMLSEQIIPDIQSFCGDRIVFHRTKVLSVFGLPEAVVNDRLSGLSDEIPGVKLGMLARFPIIYVKLTAIGKEADALDRKLACASEWAAARLDEYVFSHKGNSMEDEVAGLLLESRATIAVAESCTGGLISHMLTNVPGSSDYFLFSSVTYSNQAKIDFLGVKKDTITRYGAVSEETVREMAGGVRRVSGATLGLATSGIAGPTGATADKPVGAVCIGIAGPDGISSKSFQSPFHDRLSNKQVFAICALDLLRRKLVSQHRRKE